MVFLWHKQMSQERSSRDMNRCPRKEVVPRANESTIMQNQLENKFWSACTLLGSETRCSHSYYSEYIGDFWNFIWFNWYSLFLEFSIKWGNKLCSSNMQQMPLGPALRNSFSFSHQSLAHKVLFCLENVSTCFWPFQVPVILPETIHVEKPFREAFLFRFLFSPMSFLSSQIPPTPTDNF